MGNPVAISYKEDFGQHRMNDDISVPTERKTSNPCALENEINRSTWLQKVQFIRCESLAQKGSLLATSTTMTKMANHFAPVCIYFVCRYYKAIA